jgi:inner membrane protein
MDSITQIVLGAAVGEICLGKKLGNRAMVWGAIAGTIPDLDIISSIWNTPTDNLRSHRGISHSIFFAVTFSLLIATYTNFIYANNIQMRKWYKILSFCIGVIVILLVGLVVAIPSFTFGAGLFGKVGSIIAALAIVLFLIKRMYTYYLHENVFQSEISLKDWYWFFFWTIFTHPILDCFTVYGTQLFMPFSDRRISWDTISVADPLYTIPFGLFLLAGMFFMKGSKPRNILIYFGLVYSCGYMAFTFSNKQKVNQAMMNSLTESNIKYSRFMTNPTLLNNILWTGTVETDSVFYFGQYSLRDEDKKFILNPVPKNHILLDEIPKGDKTLSTIKWFSKDYYAVMTRKDGRLQINDLRYGTYKDSFDDEDSYIFRFILEKDKNGNYQIDKKSQGPPSMDMKEMTSKLFKRMKGLPLSDRQ